jgi:hypothetical protein
MESAPGQSKLRDAIAGPLIRGQWLNEQFFRSKNWTSFRSGLRNEFGKAGNRAGEHLERQLLEGMDMKGLQRHLDNMVPLITRMQRDMNAEHLEAIRINKAYDAELAKQAKAAEKVAKSTEKMTTANRTNNESMKDLSLKGESWRRKLDIMDDRVDHYADTAGRAFGRRARNDAVNLLGATVRGFFLLANIVPKVGKAIGHIAGVLGNMRDAFITSSGPITGTLSALGVGAKAAAPALAGMAAVMVALLAVLGPLAALLSGVVAAITALAGSVTFAAAAALGALLGTILPLVAAITVGIAAFTGLDKAQKKLLKESVRPLTREFGILGDIARDTLVGDIADAARDAAPALKGLRPVVRGVAAALGDVARNFANGLQSPAFKAFKAEMTTFLPNAVRSLGFSFNNVIQGMGGVIRALIPITNQFLGWVEKITDEFAEWANSARGQRELKSFFHDAAESAKSVGRFLRDATVALGQLLSQGRESGDSIFDRMARSLRTFTQYLKDNPKAVADFFENGERIASGLGDAVMGLVHVFDALDNSVTRLIAGGALTGFSNLMGIIGTSISAALNQLGWLIQGVGKLTGLDGLENFGKGMRSAAAGTKEAGNAASSASGGFDELAASLDQTTGAATRSTREFIKNKLATSGSLGVLNAWGASTRDVISAALGNEGAIQRVSAALDKGGASTMFARAELKKLGIDFDAAGAKVRKNGADLDTWGEALEGIKSKDVRIAIRNTGMEPTIAKFKNLIRTQKLTPRQIRIAAKALNVELTRGQLRKIIKDAKDLGKQKPTVRPKVDGKPAERALSRVRVSMAGTHRQKVNPKVQASIVAAQASLRTINRGLNNTGRVVAKPKVAIQTTGQSEVQSAKNLINSMHDKSVDVVIRTHHIGSGPKSGSAAAAGRIVHSATRLLTGESGSEAIVPLHRPLDQVDPSVRWLSAIAQGKVPGAAAGAVVGGGRSVHIEKAEFVSASPDPVTAAREWSNRMVELAYT